MQGNKEKCLLINRKANGIVVFRKVNNVNNLKYDVRNVKVKTQLSAEYRTVFPQIEKSII